MTVRPRMSDWGSLEGEGASASNSKELTPVGRERSMKNSMIARGKKEGLR